MASSQAKVSMPVINELTATLPGTFQGKRPFPGAFSFLCTPILQGVQVSEPDSADHAQFFNDPTSAEVRTFGEVKTDMGSLVNPPANTFEAITGHDEGLAEPTREADLIHFGSNDYAPDSRGLYRIAGQTMGPERPGITVSNTPISLIMPTPAIVVGDTTIPFATPTVTPQAVLTFGFQRIRSDESAAYVLDGSTLTPGGSPITVSGTPVSIDEYRETAVIGSSTQVLTTPALTPPPIRVDGRQISPDEQGNYVIDHQTLKPDGGAVTYHGTRIAFIKTPSAVVIGTSTQVLRPGISNTHIITFERQIYTADSQGAYSIEGQLLSPNGSPITISTPIQLISHGDAIVVGTSTQDLNPASSRPPVITIGKQAYTVDSRGRYSINGQLLSPDGDAVAVSGTPAHLISHGSTIVVGEHTRMLVSATTSLPPISLNGQIFTANAEGGYIIGGQKLIPGGAVVSASFPLIISNGQTFTANASGGYIIDGQDLIQGGGAGVITQSPDFAEDPALTGTIQRAPASVADHGIMPDPTGFAIENSSVGPGSAPITIAGTPVSLGTSGQLVIGNMTLLLKPTSNMVTVTIDAPGASSRNAAVHNNCVPHFSLSSYSRTMALLIPGVQVATYLVNEIGSFHAHR